MERIKQAIENAKNTEPDETSNPAQADSGGKHRKMPRCVISHQDLKNTIKEVIAIVLIFAASVLWLRLDYMNRLELGASEYIHDGIEQARAEAKKRSLDKEKFEQLILANFNHCQSTAEKTWENYDHLMQKIADKSIIYHLHLMQKLERRNVSEFVVPKSVTDEATKMLEIAKAECQQVYDAQKR